MNKQKNKQPHFVYWMISLSLCLIAEWAGNFFDGLSNFGVIFAVFLAVAFMHDFLEEKQ